MEGKQLAREIFLRTLNTLDVPSSISRCVSCSGQLLNCGEAVYDLRDFPDLRIVAIGKAAHGMLNGLVAALPTDIRFSGVVSAPAAPEQAHRGVKYFVSGHPTPNQDSLLAGQAALQLLAGCTASTLLIVLLSGGASALFESPLVPALSLHDVQRLNGALVTSGASIAEINAVRKHISAVKGGRLAQAAHPARVITLAISDVPVGHESALGSGPTLPDPTTWQDVSRILAKYQLRCQFPESLNQWVETTGFSETPKPGHAAFERCQFHLVLGMHDLFHTAHRVAESLDCLAFCDNSTDDWPVEKAAEALLLQLAELRATNQSQQPVALISDGELSSVVTGDGLGGRNSAFVLACVEKIAGRKIVVLSAGTDGIDGNSRAAGAMADGETFSRAKAAGLNGGDYFRRSDSFRFFEALGDIVLTGPTGNNLRDLRLLIGYPDA